MKELDTVSISRTVGPFTDHLRLVMQVDADPAGTDRGELSEDDLDQRFSKNREEWLRQVVRDRPEPLAETSGGEKYIDWKFWHGIPKSYFATEDSEESKKHEDDIAPLTRCQDKVGSIHIDLLNLDNPV